MSVIKEIALTEPLVDVVEGKVRCIITEGSGCLALSWMSAVCRAAVACFVLPGVHVPIVMVVGQT